MTSVDDVVNWKTSDEEFIPRRKSIDRINKIDFEVSSNIRTQSFTETVRWKETVLSFSNRKTVH